MVRLLSHNRRRLIPRKIAGACRRYLGWFDNVSYELESNGEAFVLDVLARHSPRVLFDVGANVGDWTRAAAARCPTAAIHAFEIAPPTFERLRERTRGLEGVRCQPFGLSDAPGQVRLRHFVDSPALTTASAYPHPFPSQELVGEIQRGDDYVSRTGVERIDLLKIDVEGMEEAVLKGFSSLFARQGIDLVQFEYGRVSILNGFLLRNAYAFFREHGYVVGKIYPNYVDFRDYELADEDFRGPNFLACRATRTDYLRAFNAPD
jgi:FkbM family methyltransferase